MYPSTILFLLYIMIVVGYPVSEFQMFEIRHPADSSILTKDVMILEDIQTHYENLVDVVISSHSEDFLLSMTWSMSKKKINTIYRPQISMLLNNHPTIQDKCFHQVPHWIGKYLHDIHSRAYGTVAPKVQDYMAAYWPSSRWYSEDITTGDISEFLMSLNNELLTTITLQMDVNMALTYIGHQLQLCQQEKQHENRRWGLDFLLRGNPFGHITHQQLPSSYDLNGSMRNHFFVRFLVNMHSDIVTQMHDQVSDLIPLIQDDLRDIFVDA